MAAHAESERRDDRLRGDVWSFFCRLLNQGGAIEQDYRAGKYPTYDHYAARQCEAARERQDSDEWKQLAARLSTTAPDRLAEAVELLRELEWADVRTLADCPFPVCPCCNSFKHQGHMTPGSGR